MGRETAAFISVVPCFYSRRCSCSGKEGQWHEEMAEPAGPMLVLTEKDEAQKRVV